MTIDDFWVKPKKTEFMPINVLDAQADYLKKNSKGKLGAQTVKTYPNSDDVVRVSFFIIATEFRGYSYRLLWFDQTLDIFPFKVNAFSNPTQDFGIVHNMEEFIETIKKVLGDERTATILGNLLTMGNAVEVDNED